MDRAERYGSCRYFLSDIEILPDILIGICKPQSDAFGGIYGRRSSDSHKKIDVFLPCKLYAFPGLRKRRIRLNPAKVDIFDAFLPERFYDSIVQPAPFYAAPAVDEKDLASSELSDFLTWVKPLASRSFIATCMLFLGIRVMSPILKVVCVG